jgi:hypothetical protein
METPSSLDQAITLLISAPEVVGSYILTEDFSEFPLFVKAFGERVFKVRLLQIRSNAIYYYSLFNTSFNAE